MLARILLVLLSIMLSFTHTACTKKNQEQKIPPAFVETTHIILGSNQQSLSLTGNVVANPGIVVRSEIAGRITKIFFKSGEKVVAGAPLVEIYPDIIKAEVAQDQADLKLKQLSYGRMAKLYTTRTVSKAEYDDASAALDSAKAKADEANATLRQTLLTASFDGRVGINLVNLGDYVNAGQAIVSLQALDPIYVDFSVPEIYVHQVHANQEVSVTSEASPKDIFKGKVFAIDPLADVNTRSIKIRAIVPNQEEKLIPGTFVEVTLLMGEPQQVVKIPQIAVVYDAAGDYVYKVINGHAKKTMVVLGKRGSTDILVKQGLMVGDVIVTAGQLKIAADGAAVVEKTMNSKK